MQVRELLEKALYLSIKDRNFNTLPSNEEDKDAFLSQFLDDLSQVLAGIGKKNPAFTHLSFKTEELKEDSGLNMSYVDLTEGPFLTIFRVEFVYSGGSFSITLKRAGINDFFSNSDVRTFDSFPALYNYNVFSNRVYIYPTPSTSGEINVFGKQKIIPINSEEGVEVDPLDKIFPEYCSETFLLYLQYVFAKFICSQYNAPWQAQKEDLLKSYGRLVDSENNTAYQEISINDGGGMSMKNIRVNSMPVSSPRIG